MKILAFYLDANKNHNNVRLIKAATLQESKLELDEKTMLVKSYTGAQYLAVVQLLLDICMDDGNVDEKVLEEIRDISCVQIHQMFVADPALPKLVHFNVSFYTHSFLTDDFQMYPVELIPMVVQKVPSAHVLIGAVADLIVHAHLERRIFAINLVAELAEKVCLTNSYYNNVVFQYTIAIALSAVEFVEDVLVTLLESTIDEHTIILFLNTCGALQKFMKFGPPHNELVEGLLRRVREIAWSRCSSYRSDTAVFSSPERALISRIDEILGSC
jgi:integrator complex subunit 2